MTNLPNMSDPSTLAPQFQHDEVAKEAFRIWCDEGCPEGRAEENWRQAQARLASRRDANPNRPTRENVATRRGSQLR